MSKEKTLPRRFKEILSNFDYKALRQYMNRKGTPEQKKWYKNATDSQVYVVMLQIIIMCYTQLPIEIGLKAKAIYEKITAETDKKDGEA